MYTMTCFGYNDVTTSNQEKTAHCYITIIKSNSFISGHFPSSQLFTVKHKRARVTAETSEIRNITDCFTIRSNKMRFRGLATGASEHKPPLALFGMLLDISSTFHSTPMCSYTI